MGDLSDLNRSGAAVGVSLPGASLDTTTAAGRLLALLEERVAGLVERYAGARKTIEELQARLSEREARLSQVVDEQDQLKQQLRERLGSVIERVEALERENSVDGDAGP